jgi:hypothetical protein
MIGMLKGAAKNNVTCQPFETCYSFIRQVFAALANEKGRRLNSAADAPL